MRLTKVSVSRLQIPEGKSELLVFDDELPSFGLRFRRGGSRTWFVQYRQGKRQRRMVVGKYPALPPEKARNMAGELLARVRLGEDPQAIRQESRFAVPEKKLTIGDIVAQYLEAASKRQKPSTYKETHRHLSRDWTVLHAMPVADIEREHVAVEIRRLAKQTGPVNANRARANLSACFSWAMGEGLAPKNPVVGTNKAIDETPRDRVLTHAEIRTIWQRTAAPHDFDALVRLLLLTGQRREEVASMSWSELDLDDSLWHLPKERTKNGRPHIVPLSDMVMSILAARPRRSKRDLVFGHGHGGFSGWSKSKQRLDSRINLLPWRIHDLRRTFVTGLYEIGTQPHVVEAVVNHISGHRAGVAGVYNRAEYLPEKRRALAEWADHLMALLNGS